MSNENTHISHEEEKNVGKTRTYTKITSFSHFFFLSVRQRRHPCRLRRAHMNAQNEREREKRKATRRKQEEKNFVLEYKKREN